MSGKETRWTSPPLAKTYFSAVFYYVFIPVLVFVTFILMLDLLSRALWWDIVMMLLVVAIHGVIYQCASLSLFSWFDLKIKQAVTCAESVCHWLSMLRLFGNHTAPNPELTQGKWGCFVYSMLRYSDVHVHAHFHLTVDQILLLLTCN